MDEETIAILLQRVGTPDVPPVTRLIPGHFVAQGTTQGP